VIHRNLNGRIADDEVASKDVPLNSGTYEDPIGVADDRVFLNYIVGVTGSGKTDAKITALG
jgi:hypothetical protein